MARVLVIEDEPDLRKVLEFHLRDQGYEVSLAGTGWDGLRAADEHPPDLVILDLMLPDLRGTQVCQKLRSGPRGAELPILMLTAKGEESDRVVGFEAGADDYVVKPFSVRELMLRVQALLRRASTGAAATQQVEFGCLRFNRGAHRAWVNGAEVELTALEFKLMSLLHERRGRVQSREALLDEVWGEDAEFTARAVDTSVKRLREKLGPAGEYVQTVRGVGYRFADRPESEG